MRWPADGRRAGTDRRRSPRSAGARCRRRGGLVTVAGCARASAAQRRRPGAAATRLPSARMQYTARSFSELLAERLLPRPLAPRVRVAPLAGCFPAPATSRDRRRRSDHARRSTSRSSARSAEPLRAAARACSRATRTSTSTTSWSRCSLRSPGPRCARGGCREHRARASPGSRWPRSSGLPGARAAARLTRPAIAPPRCCSGSRRSVPRRRARPRRLGAAGRSRSRCPGSCSASASRWASTGSRPSSCCPRSASRSSRASTRLAYWPPPSHPRSARRLRLAFGLLAAGWACRARAPRLRVPRRLGGDGARGLLLRSRPRTSARRCGARDSSTWPARARARSRLFGAFALLHAASGGLRAGRGARALDARGEPRRSSCSRSSASASRRASMPLHVWLPGAHAIAPSHVSALMSGVLIKMGIYGLVRVASLLPPLPPAGGAPSCSRSGVLSAVLGVAFALGQHDLKRLLAYHSIENIGIIVMGLGLGAARPLARAARDRVVLGLGGALLHVWNHALFKALLFLGAGSVIHATGTRRDRSPRRPGATDAAHRALLPGRRRRDLRPAAAQRLRQRAPDLPRAVARRAARWAAARLARACSASPALALIGALARGVLREGLRRRLPREPRTASGRAAPTRRRAACSCRWRVLALCCVAIGLAPALVAAARSSAACAASVPTLGRRGPALAALAPARLRSRVAAVVAARALVAAARVAAPRGAGPRGASRHLGLRLRRAVAAHAVHRVVVRRDGWSGCSAGRCWPQRRRARRRAAPFPAPARLPQRAARPGARPADPARRRAGSRGRRSGSAGSSTGSVQLVPALHPRRADRRCCVVASGSVRDDAARSRRPPRRCVLLLPPLLLGVISTDQGAVRGPARPAAAPALLRPREAVPQGRRCSAATTTWVFRAGPGGRRWRPRCWRRCWSRSASLPRRSSLHGRPDPVRLPARPRPLLHDRGGARHRLGLRGHGRAREVTFACLAEPALFLGLLVLVELSRRRSRSRAMLGAATGVAAGRRPAPRSPWSRVGRFVVLLAENCRIPFDDPNTHLELTMIHEVMVLDHSGPALGADPYGAALKLFVLRRAAGRGCLVPLPDGLPLAATGRSSSRRCSALGGRRSASSSRRWRGCG